MDSPRRPGGENCVCYPAGVVGTLEGVMLTVKQVAERLGISPSLVYGLCGAGKIRHERYGLGRGCIRVPEDALDEYRRGQMVVVARPSKIRSQAPKLKRLSLS